MKIIVVLGLALALIGVAIADDRALVESLEKRAESLDQKVKSSLESLKKADYGHLLSQLEHLFSLTDGLVVSLKEQLADRNQTFESTQTHVIEEDLHHLENAVSDEIKVIQDIIQTHQHTPHTNAQLVAKAHALVKKAHDTLTHHKGVRETHAINAEIAEIEKLIKAIEVKAITAPELKKDEEALARHEKTLNGLIDKVNHRVKAQPATKKPVH